MSSSSSLVPFDSPQWKFREPRNVTRVDASKTSLTIESGPKTDWWRTAIGSEPESDVNRNSGPLSYFEVPSEKSHWKAGAWISGCFDERFKQATLFIGLDRYTEHGKWVKAGIEVEDGKHNVGCVVAAPYSDWAITTLKETIGSNPGEFKLYIQFTRAQADVFVHYAVKESVEEESPAELHLLREIKGFAANQQQSASSPWHLGVMVCGPLSQSTLGQWDHFQLKMG